MPPPRILPSCLTARVFLHLRRKNTGEGNSAKLVGDIVNSTTQITEGFSAGMGIDLKSLLLGALGTKVVDAADNN